MPLNAVLSAEALAAEQDPYSSAFGFQTTDFGRDVQRQFLVSEEQVNQKTHTISLENIVSKKGKRRPELRKFDSKHNTWVTIPSEYSKADSVLVAMVSEAGLYSVSSEDEFEPGYSITPGQVALFTGDYSTDYSLYSPAGAGGMSIPLNLSFLSSAINNSIGQSDGGWLGIGWDMELGEITLIKDDEEDEEQSTAYSDNRQMKVGSESFELIFQDESELGCTDSTAKWHCVSKKEKNYRTKHTSGWKIREVSRTWEGEAGKVCLHPSEFGGRIEHDSYFEATSPNGLIYTFGKGSGDNRGYNQLPFGDNWGEIDDETKGTDSRAFYVEDRNGEKRGIVFGRYKLESIEDRFGNKLEVNYQSFRSKKRPNNCEYIPEYGSKEVYPDNIQYSTNDNANVNDDHAEWEIKFDVERKAFDVKEDVGIAQTGAYLKGVKTLFHSPGTSNSRTVHEYAFTYAIDDDNPDQQRSYRLTRIQEWADGGANGSNNKPWYEIEYTEIEDALRYGWEGPHGLRRYFPKRIKNGYSGVTELSYLPFKSTGYKRQVVDTVSYSQTLGAPDGGFSVDRYEYSTPVFNTITDDLPMTTQALIGFEWGKRISGNNDHYVKNRFHVYDNLPEHMLNGKVTETKIGPGANGTPWSASYTAWAKRDDTQGTATGTTLWYPWQTYSTQITDAGNHIITSWQRSYYNRAEQNCSASGCDAEGEQYGNLTKTEDLAADGTVVRTTLNNYCPNTTLWTVGAGALCRTELFNGEWAAGKTPVNSTYFIKSSPGSASWKGTVDGTGKLYHQRQMVALNKFADTSYDYDARGNQIATTVYRSYGSQNALASPDSGLTSTSQYDPNALAVVSSTNTLGQTVHSKYYGINESSTAVGSGMPGQLKQTIGLNGESVRYQYDGFGRKTHMWSPLVSGWSTSNASEKWTWEDIHSPSNTESFRNGHHVRVDDIDSGPVEYRSSYSFLDARGAELQSKSLAASGKTQIVNTYYDAFGRPVEKSIIHGNQSPLNTMDVADYNAKSVPSTTTTYDALSRVTAITTPSGATSYTWFNTNDQFNILTRDANFDTAPEKSRYVLKRFDTMGRVIEVKDDPAATQSTKYTFRADGVLKKIQDVEGNQWIFTHDKTGQMISKSDPDLGTISNKYAANGELISSLDARGVLTCLYYDDLGRKTGSQTLDNSASCPSTPNPDRTWEYDDPSIPYGIGKISRTSSDVVTREYTYNIAGQIIEDKYTGLYDPDSVLSNSYKYRFGYTHGGSLDWIEYPALIGEGLNGQPERVELEYGQAGLPLSVIGDITYATGAVYGDRNEPRALTLGIEHEGSPLTRYWDYYGCAQNDCQLKRLYTYSQTKAFQDLSYLDYDAAGKITKFTRRYDITGGSGTAGHNLYEYDYDHKGHLISATMSELGVGGQPNGDPRYTLNYQYDALGRQIHRSATSILETLNYSQDIGYDDPTHIHARTYVGDQWSNGYSYDKAGNLVSIADSSSRAPEKWIGQLTWNGYGKLTHISDRKDRTSTFLETSFYYDSNDLLLIKETSAGTREYYLGDFQITVKNGNISRFRKYYSFGSQKVTTCDFERIDHPTGNFQSSCNWMLSDHLGSNSLVVGYDPQGNWQQEKLEYLPFGETWNSELVSKSTDFGYAGELTAEALGGIQPSRARVYSPTLAQWMTPDPAPFGSGLDPYDPRQLNRYAYVNSDPVNQVDPTGYWIETVWDVANVAMGAKSFYDNMKAGNYGAAAMDGVGVVVDTAAVIAPFVPAGVGMAIRTGRNADKAVDAARYVTRATTSPTAPSFWLRSRSSMVAVGDSIITYVDEGFDGLRSLTNRVSTYRKNYFDDWWDQVLRDDFPTTDLRAVGTNITMGASHTPTPGTAYAAGSNIIQVEGRITNSVLEAGTNELAVGNLASGLDRIRLPDDTHVTFWGNLSNAHLRVPNGVVTIYGDLDNVWIDTATKNLPVWFK